MSELDAVTIRARKTLLDVLEALEPHISDVVVVGAQALYLNVAPDLVRTAPFTRDADLAIRPGLAEQPALQDCLNSKGFTFSTVGTWRREGEKGVRLEVADDEVDLLVPAAVAPGGGRRSVALPGAHDRKATRKTKGLEGCLIDCELKPVSALDPDDSRVYMVAVAGTAALLVSKLHKLGERIDEAKRSDRVRGKDALDVLRLLRHAQGEKLDGDDRTVAMLRDLAQHEHAKAVTEEALDYLASLFGTKRGVGTRLAIEALDGIESSDVVEASCVALSNGLLDRVGAH